MEREITITVALFVVALLVYCSMTKPPCRRKIYNTKPTCGTGSSIYDLGGGEPGLKKLNDLETDYTQLPTYKHSRSGYILPNVTESGWLTMPSHAGFGMDTRINPMQEKYDDYLPLRNSLNSEIAKSLNMFDVIRLSD